MSRPAPAAFSDGPLPEYRLNSDLALYCLPASNRDDTRRLAWANSVCLLFLTVAIIGVKQPVFVIREVAPLPEPMAVTILPPPVEQEPQVVSKNEEEPVEEAPDNVEMPVVAPVMVAAAQDVSFSVPVEGFTAVAKDARYVPPPPPVIPKAPPPDNLPKPPTFKAIRLGGNEFKKQPPPKYPAEFERNRIAGTVEALITVGANGLVEKVEVGRSSGFPALDRYVCDFIQREWKAEPGEGGFYRIAMTFLPAH